MENLIKLLETNHNIQIIDVDDSWVQIKYNASGSYAMVYPIMPIGTYRLFSTEIKVPGDYNLSVSSYPGFNINSIINQYK